MDSFDREIKAYKIRKLKEPKVQGYTKEEDMVIKSGNGEIEKANVVKTISLEKSATPMATGKYKNAKYPKGKVISHKKY